jgi:hypothetical protein
MPTSKSRNFMISRLRFRQLLKKQARLLFQICHPRKLLKVNRVYAAIITQITNYCWRRQSPWNGMIYWVMPPPLPAGPKNCRSLLAGLAADPPRSNSRTIVKLSPLVWIKSGFWLPLKVDHSRRDFVIALDTPGTILNLKKLASICQRKSLSKFNYWWKLKKPDLCSENSRKKDGNLMQNMRT